MRPLPSCGILTADPSRAAPIGSKLTFRTIACTTAIPEQHAALLNWGIFRGVLLSIHIKGHDHKAAYGSGIMVAPGVALAARHVIDEHIDDIMSGDALIYCTGIRGRRLQIWKVTNVTSTTGVDICILGLVAASAFPDNKTYYSMAMNARMPAEGERVRTFGFVQASSIEQDYEDRTSGAVLACHGTVLKRYVSGRDRVMIPAPCLEIDCGSAGGMSGGPAFDKDGFLIGLVTSSYEEAAGPTFVSALWPMLNTKYKGGWPVDCFTGTRTLMSLANENSLCHIEDRFRVTEIITPDGQRLARYDDR